MFRQKTRKEEEYLRILDKLKDIFVERFEKIQPSSAEGLDNYEKIRTLGAGSFGKVFLIKEKSSGLFSAMKVLSKHKLIKQKQVEQTYNEKKILMSVHFPFIVSMIACFKDYTYIYFVMPFINGGEMFTHLRKKGKFDEELSKFYGAQVLLGLEYLHHCSVVYRDLKPENILIDYRGYIKITDLGFCKVIRGRTWTLCGTPEYIAPEIILSKGYAFAVDWWSFGVLLFEMSAGYPPFTSRDPMKIYEKIITARYKLAQVFSNDLKDLIQNLLQLDLSRRYGNLKNGVGDIKNHKWFKDISYSKLYMRTVSPPYVPEVKTQGDDTNFERMDEAVLQKSHFNIYEEEFALF